MTFELTPPPESAPKQKRAKRPAKPKPVYREASPLEVLRANSLHRVSMLPGSPSKRFARNIRDQVANGHGITDKQATLLAVYCWRFRRQLPGAAVPSSAP